MGVPWGVPKCASHPKMATRLKEGEVDEEGIEPKDIELVVSQVNCSRAKAVEALRSWVAVTAFSATHW